MPTPDPDKVLASGGLCAPTAPFYEAWHLPQHPSPEALAHATEALGVWFNAAEQEGLVAGAALDTDDDARQQLIEGCARVALEAYLNQPPIRLSLPRLSAPRGGIHFITPPDITSPEWRQRAQARLKRRERLSRIAAPFRRARAARGRLRDARAVWRGTKTAFTDAEVDALADY